MTNIDARAAERAFLASVIADEDRIHDAADHIDTLEEADFEDPGLRALFVVIAALRKDKQAINIASLFVAAAGRGLSRDAVLDLVGRPDTPATGAQASYFAAAIRSQATRRRLKALRVASIVDSAESPSAAISAVRAEIDSIERRSAAPVTFESGVDLAASTLQRIEARARGDVGLSTGLRVFDRALGGGLQPGRVYVLAARTSVGKSALASTIAGHVAIEIGKQVLMYSLEMPRAEVAERIVAAQTGLAASSLSGSNPAVHACLGRLSDAPLQIRDTRPSIRALVNEVWAFHRTAAPVELLIVDYLQLIQPSAVSRQRTKNDDVAEMSAELKALAMRIGAPVIALAQMNRDIERRGPDAAPNLADLRDSGAIEQDADAVAFLRRDGWDPTQAEGGWMRIDVLKSRGGAQGFLRLWFDGPTFRFSDVQSTRSLPGRRGMEST